VTIAALWRDQILPSWPSFAAAPLVWCAYGLIGLRCRIGWWFTITSQAALVLIALEDHQWGLLLIVPATVGVAFASWVRWGRPDPVVVQLEAELAAARARIADLEGLGSAGEWAA
jgi:hypothetical protein